MYEPEVQSLRILLRKHWFDNVRLSDKNDFEFVAALFQGLDCSLYDACRGVVSAHGINSNGQHCGVVYNGFSQLFAALATTALPR